MFRRPSKKQLIVQRTIVSIISVIAVIVIVFCTILFILGFRLNSDGGRLEQGALLQFDTRPTGATVTIDGTAVGPRTSTKQTVVAGTHSLIMSRQGYKDWNKTLTVEAGTLTWLDYVRLIPTTLTPQSVSSFGGAVAVKAAPDNETMIVQEAAAAPIFQLIDIRNQDIRRSTITLPAALYSQADAEGVTHTFTLDAWDNGGRFMLVKHQFNDASEWLVMDTENPDRSVNVTRLLSIQLASLQFAGTNGSVLFGLGTDGVIRKLDLSSATISRGLVAGVTSFNLFETTMLSYVGVDQQDATKQVAGVYRDGDESPHILRREAVGTPLSIDTARYYSDDYVAISVANKVYILKGRYPVSSQEDTASLQPFAELTAGSNVERLSFSPEGDYIVVQAGKESISYEVEYKRETRSTIETAAATTPLLRWLDKAYAWSVIDGTATIREFDGTNVSALLPGQDGFDITLSRNGRYLYSVSNVDGQYRLQRVELILQ